MMIREMKNSKVKIKDSKRRGAALLVVLLIVITATILSVSFLSRSDVEMACGENMILRTGMDYLAESGLEHARGLILNPQDVASEYWTGEASQQIIAGGDDYYDVGIVRSALDRCDYVITSDAYRLKDGERVGESSWTAQLRLDPAIAFWTGVSTAINQRITIDGDVYCNGTLSGDGLIDGDVFAAGSVTATNIEGEKNESVTSAPVDWPGVEVTDLSLKYYIDSVLYSVQQIADGNQSAVTFGPTSGNPAGVHYYNGSLRLDENVIINGTLVVRDHLTIKGGANQITAAKNFPALVIGGQLLIEESAGLTVNGLVQSGQKIHIKGNTVNVDIEIVGGLFIKEQGIQMDNLNFGNMTVTAGPAIASIEVWPQVGTVKRWTPSAGAFFRSIGRD